MRITLLACALIASLMGFSQASTAATPTSSSTTKKAPPRGLPDAVLERNIKTKLAKSKIGADKFTIKVQNGVAYWEGKTDVIQHKGAATRMARTAGVAAVVNNIQISDAARRKAAHNLSGTTPRALVKHPDTAMPQSK